LRLFALWIGLLSLIIHAPAHATGQGLLRGGEVEHLRIVQEIATVPRLVFAAHPDGTPSTRLAEQ